MEYLDIYEDHCQTLRQKKLFRKLSGAKPKEHWAYLDFSSNDYLNLSKHPVVLKKSKEFLEKYGTGSRGARLLAGNLEVCTELEHKISQAKKTGAALMFSSAYQANSTVIPALLNKQVLKDDPLILTDKLIHASMHMGIRASGLRQIRYGHLDMNRLESLLRKSSHKTKFIFSETVFGMDGDVVDMESITFLAKKYDAFLYLDDTHDVGLHGENGYGLSTKYADAIGITVGAFSKALGSFGGFIACSNKLRDYLVNTCGGFIYSTALPPAIIGANQAAWELLPSLNEIRQGVFQTAQDARHALSERGFNIGHTTTNIIPIIVEEADAALKLQEYLLEKGVIVSAIRPPSVPLGSSRLRLSICANHVIEDVNRLVMLLEEYKCPQII